MFCSFWGRPNGSLAFSFGHCSQENTDHAARDQKEAAGIMRKIYGNKLHGNRDVGVERAQLREMFSSLSMHESLQNRKE